MKGRLTALEALRLTLQLPQRPVDVHKLTDDELYALLPAWWPALTTVEFEEAVRLTRGAPSGEPTDPLDRQRYAALQAIATARVEEQP